MENSDVPVAGVGGKSWYEPFDDDPRDLDKFMGGAGAGAEAKAAVGRGVRLRSIVGLPADSFSEMSLVSSSEADPRVWRFAVEVDALALWEREGREE